MLTTSQKNSLDILYGKYFFPKVMQPGEPVYIIPNNISELDQDDQVKIIDILNSSTPADFNDDEYGFKLDAFKMLTI